MENKQSLVGLLQKGMINALYHFPKSIQNLLYHIMPVLVWDLFVNVAFVASKYTKIVSIIGLMGGFYRWFEEELYIEVVENEKGNESKKSK